MSCWFCIPSARPFQEADKVFKLWRHQGYKIALWRDTDPSYAASPFPNRIIWGEYPGYAQAVNALVLNVIEHDPTAEWFISGGDDTEPDLNYSAEEIAEQCARHFGLEQTRLGITSKPGTAPTSVGPYSTFGVMQPTGDRYAGGSIDRICGSPWMGREFCQRINRGDGPLWPEYRHMFVDEELFEVSKKLGILWQRPDLIHLHHHFMRVSPDVNSNAVQRQPPPFLVEANSPHHWNTYQLLFNQRKAARFPGHEPIPVEELVAR